MYDVAVERDILFSKDIEDEEFLSFQAEETAENGINVSEKSENQDSISISSKAWKILVVDDEADIHSVTKLVLDGYRFEQKTLKFYNAYSAEEAKKYLETMDDIAIVLLDVVMENNFAGLDLVKYIRDVLCNKFIRIILRTGQPGKAPEERIIVDYDINDYKNKTELTSDKLFTTVTSALRSYKDLKTLDRSRMGLELIIESSAQLFEEVSLKKFARGVLNQILSLLSLEEDSMYVHSSGFAVTELEGKYYIMAATGKYEPFEDRFAEQVVDLDIIAILNKAVETQSCVFDDDVYVGYFCTRNNSVNLLYLNGYRSLSIVDKDLINIFSSNVAIAFDNISLNEEIISTQREVVNTLGETVETRSREAAKHVIRVAEDCYLLAKLLGLDETVATLLQLAGPLHDIGKIGIPDSILNKPGSLTDLEFEFVKSHTTLGFDILKNSNREIIQTAAIIAQQHHEHWDGKGYPHGRKGSDIHIYGRICAVADVFDVLSHQRIYKESWSKDKIVAYFKEQKGKQFDPKITDVFLENIDAFYKINDKYPGVS